MENLPTTSSRLRHLRARVTFPRNLTAVHALWLVITLGVVVRMYRLTAPLLDAHFFRQTQTASQVWMWDRFGFTPLEYRVPMYGGGHWILEFPWYQWIVYALTVPFGFHEELGRLVSIAAFVASAYLLFAIGRRLLGSRAAAVAAVAAFSFMPLTVFYYRAFLIDPLLVAAALLLFLAALKIGETFRWTWVAIFIAMVFVIALGKANLLVVFGLPIVVVVLRALRARVLPVRGFAALVGGAAAAAIALLFWTRYADELNFASNGQTFANMRWWYFGSTFFDVQLWLTIGQRFIEMLTPGGVLLAGVGLGVALTLRDGRRGIILALLASNIASIAVFANLNRVHDYYQLPYFTTLALFLGLGVWTVATGLGRIRSKTIGIAAGLLIALTALWMANLFGPGYFRADAVQYGLVGQGSELADRTPDAQVLALMAGNPDPNEPAMLYLARRTGWRIPLTDQTQAEAIIGKATNLGSIAVYKDPTGGIPVPAWVAPLAAKAGFTLTHDSDGLAIYS